MQLDSDNTDNSWNSHPAEVVGCGLRGGSCYLIFLSVVRRCYAHIWETRVVEETQMVVERRLAACSHSSLEAGVYSDRFVNLSFPLVHNIVRHFDSLGFLVAQQVTEGQEEPAEFNAQRWRPGTGGDAATGVTSRRTEPCRSKGIIVTPGCRCIRYKQASPGIAKVRERSGLNRKANGNGQRHAALPAGGAGTGARVSSGPLTARRDAWQGRRFTQPTSFRECPRRRTPSRPNRPNCR